MAYLGGNPISIRVNAVQKFQHLDWRHMGLQLPSSLPLSVQRFGRKLSQQRGCRTLHRDANPIQEELVAYAAGTKSRVRAPVLVDEAIVGPLARKIVWLGVRL